MWERAEPWERDEPRERDELWERLHSPAQAKSKQVRLPLCNLTANPQLIPHAPNCQTARRIKLRYVDLFDSS